MSHFMAEDATPLYVARYVYIGPNQDENSDADYILITPDAGTGGAFGDWSWDWSGPYAGIDAARQAVAELYGHTRLIDPDRAANMASVEVVEAFRIGKYRPLSLDESGQFCWEFRDEISAESSDSEIEDVAAEAELNAEQEGCTLTGVREFLLEHRQELREEVEEDDAPGARREWYELTPYLDALIESGDGRVRFKSKGPYHPGGPDIYLIATSPRPAEGQWEPAVTRIDHSSYRQWRRAGLELPDEISEQWELRAIRGRVSEITVRGRLDYPASITQLDREIERARAHLHKLEESREAARVGWDEEKQLARQRRAKWLTAMLQDEAPKSEPARNELAAALLNIPGGVEGEWAEIVEQVRARATSLQAQEPGMLARLRELAASNEIREQCPDWHLDAVNAALELIG